MIGPFNLKNKIIALVALFTVLIFGLHQHQHTASVTKTVVEAEASRNALLLQTILPIVQTNLAFGLMDSNREYLDTIARDNPNIIAMTLRNDKEMVLYRYGNINYGNNAAVSESNKMSHTITDKVTETLMGTLEIHFSNVFFQEILKRHQHFTYQYIALILLLLVLMLWIMTRAFAPMERLLVQIRNFNPSADNCRLEHTMRQDEAGIIQNALADMTDRVREHSRMLAELNQTLENKVHERTAELEMQTHILEQKIEEVQEQEKMLIAQSRLAAMGEMMSMIAHQWRQPLSTSSLMITNYKIKSMLAGKEPGEYDGILDHISETLIYLSETIDDFQTYFKPDREKSDCALDEVVTRATHFTEARLKSYGVALVRECEHDLHVKSYFNELVQILMNIINNAIDAIGHDSKSAKTITISCSTLRDGRIALQIADTGGGIEDSLLEKVFEPYFSTKGKNGTGLGLYMAKMIVERHIGGTIMAGNIKGGARFTIIFPLS